MTENITITTNNVPRLIVDAWDLPANVRAEFDYIDWQAVENGETSAEFVQYKGTWYHLGDLEYPVSTGMEWMAEWTAYVSDSFFSGVLVRFVDDDHVVMGRYFS